MNRIVVPTLIAAAIAASSWSIPQLHAQATAIRPVVTTKTLTLTTASLLVTTNPTRRSIRICNTGATNAIWVWAGPASPVLSDYILAPVTSNVIACYTPPTAITNDASQQYSAQAVGSGGSTVSIEEW
jgi:hypothetical protein